MEETMKQGFKPADYKNSQNARWCPGCGDHAILNVLHKAMAELGVPPEKPWSCQASDAAPDSPTI